MGYKATVALTNSIEKIKKELEGSSEYKGVRKSISYQNIDLCQITYSYTKTSCRKGGSHPLREQVTDAATEANRKASRA